MRNQFILSGFDWVVRRSQDINLVEHVKSLAVWGYSKWLDHEPTVEQKRAVAGLAIDVFVVAKFALIAWLIAVEVSDTWSKYLVYYLIWSNVFTYFYYHVWGSRFQQQHDLVTQRRRFLNFLLAIAFYILCYAYLYEMHFAQVIQWPDGLVDTTNAIYLSVANAFTLTYGGFMPLAQETRVLFMTELINTFFFFSIILANSVPPLNQE